MENSQCLVRASNRLQHAVQATRGICIGATGWMWLEYEQYIRACVYIMIFHLTIRYHDMWERLIGGIESTIASIDRIRLAKYYLLYTRKPHLSKRPVMIHMPSSPPLSVNILRYPPTIAPQCTEESNHSEGAIERVSNGCRTEEISNHSSSSKVIHALYAAHFAFCSSRAPEATSRLRTPSANHVAPYVIPVVVLR